MYINIDINTYTTPFFDRVVAQADKLGYFVPEMLYPYIDQYAGTDVTDLLINTFCQLSATDSEHWMTFCEKCDQKTENGHEVDYSKYYRSLKKIMREYKTDPYDVWFKRCREVGIRPWITIRMNDAHNAGDAPYFIRSDFLYEAIENGWTLGPDYGYYGYNFNYAVREVREKMLAYITEQLMHCDVDGLELDFIREIMCFRYKTADMDECRSIMNDFIRGVKQAVSEAEKVHGHRIRLGVRTMRDYRQALRYGFDPAAWAREGLIDLLVPSPRWASSDSGVNIREWKGLMGDVEVAGCTETILRHEYSRGISGFMSAATIRGHLASFFAQGADSAYCYNLFSDPDVAYAKDELPDGHNVMRNREVYTTCGSYDEIMRRPVRFCVVSECDRYPDSFDYWQPLPCTVGSDGAKFEITTGRLPEGKRVSVVVGVDEGFENAAVSFNGRLLGEPKIVDLSMLPGFGMQPSGCVSEKTVCYRYAVETASVTEEVQTIEVHGVGAVVDWVEIDVL